MAVKLSTKHPYAALEHRVIDSPAYASLTFSARALLTMLTRQLTRDNNGHLQATAAYLEQYGFSDKTITRGVNDLITAGLIYRTRCGGFHQGPSRYAVTWLPITQRTGLYLHGFKACAWRDWQPAGNKNTPPKLRTYSRKNDVRTPPAGDKNTAVPGDKSTDIELMPCRGFVSALDSALGSTRSGGPPVLAGGRLPPLDSRTWH